MSTAGETPAPTVWPVLRAHDAPALIEFLERALGFERAAVSAEGQRVVHAQLSWPEGGGVMLSSHQPGSAWNREPGSAGMYVVTDHVDALYERAKQAGAEIHGELADQDYGNREFSVVDPEGNLWSFGPYRGESRS